MRTSRGLHLPAAGNRRQLVRAVRGLVQGLALTAGLLSSGLVPAYLLSGESNESRLADSSSDYAELHSDARLRPRQILAHRVNGVAFLPLEAVTGPAASSAPHTTAGSLSIVCLSLGHSAPMRC
jgi:hypothetical protein